MMRRCLIVAQSCGGPLFVALIHLNTVRHIGPLLKRTVAPAPLHPLTRLVYDMPLLVTVPLGICALINGILLFQAWRQANETASTMRLETHACLASGIVSLAWIFGILFATFITFLGTIQGVRPDAVP